MKTSHLTLLLATVAALFLFTGCEGQGPEQPRPARESAAPARDTSPAEPAAEAKQVLVSPNIWLEVQGKQRRVIVSAEVCLREGPLELLLCGKNTKEHEAILHADVDARRVHEALILAGASEGTTVHFRPRFKPPTGTTIRVFVQYEDKDKKRVRVNARDWVKNAKTGKTLETDWVFAGSLLIDNPLDPKKPRRYLANDGDMICVSNFEDAMLDLPIASSKDDADRAYVAFTDRIPPLETKLAVILEPVLDGKKDKK